MNNTIRTAQTSDHGREDIKYDPWLKRPTTETQFVERWLSKYQGHDLHKRWVTLPGLEHYNPWPQRNVTKEMFLGCRSRAYLLQELENAGTK